MLHTGRIVELRKKTCLVDTDQGVFDAAFRGTLAKRERPLTGDVVDIAPSGGCKCKPAPLHILILRSAARLRRRGPLPGFGRGQ